MSIKSTKAALTGVLLIEPDIFRDPRGFFLETYHQQKYTAVGVDRVFVQDNHSHSKQGILRGLHYQLKRPQAKLIYVVTGAIFDVAVDIRKGSPTFGQWVGIHLSMDNNRQMFVPEGFAHGFCVLSKTADVIYKCTDLYDPGDEFGIVYSDPTIGIAWPIKNPILSSKDSQSPELGDVQEADLPVYMPG